MFSSRGAFKDESFGEDVFSGCAFKDKLFGEDVFSGGAYKDKSFGEDLFSDELASKSHARRIGLAEAL